MGVGLGYPLTGLITQAFDFHFAYWFGAVLALGAVALVVVVLPTRSAALSRTFDLIGAVTLSVVVIGISVVLSEGGTWGWSSARILGIIAACVVILPVWIFHELRQADPLIDLRQVKHRSVLTADASGFMISVSMYLFIPVVVEYVQLPTDIGGFGTSIVVAGLVLLPLSVATLFASRCLPLYERRFGTRTMIPLGALVFGAAAAFFGLEHRALWEAFVAAGFAGIGLGFTYAAMPGFIVRAVPAGETGSATGFYAVLRSVGLSVGSALAAAVLLAYTKEGQTYPSEAGFRVALLAASGFCLATALLAYLLPGRSGARASSLTGQQRQALAEMVKEEGELAGAGIMLAEDPVPFPGEPMPLSGEPVPFPAEPLSFKAETA